MRIFGRRADDRDATATLEPPLFSGDDEALRARIRELEESDDGVPGADALRELLALRNLAGVRALARPAVDPTHPEPDTEAFPGPLPELDAAELSPARLRAAILDGGGLLVRGLIPRERAVRFADGIDHAYAERERHDAGEPHDPAWYSEFVPEASRGRETARDWVKQGGGVLAADSPRLSFEMLKLFRAARVPELVAGYLGEPGLITAQKTTLRRAEPTVSGAWHQDGKFMGPVRSLNLWVALSRCGDVAPGLDVVPERLDFVPTTSDEPPLHYLVAQETAERAAGGRGIQRPIFEPGDAMLFDELFLHQTAADPAMPNPRHAIENWFFGASGFPTEYAPLSV